MRARELARRARALYRELFRVSKAFPTANRGAYVRAKTRAEFEKNASVEGDALEEALRLGEAQVENARASAEHLTKVFADERVHARV
ncbi:Complex 1 LYR protein [Ostreococcus tauri]|uniref:Complex 1 LYR protein n=1 Tax=Ostreococcus tauri TaxID=70448 RepID=A0A090M0C1_OSTTA|nr:Complex 1 LYR protein [Ostreococcus tauri]CEF97626.1 Complex 1 LYR protein [Ostreococcus tauri]|eukprot:XP_003078848.2 Complex 1 LYR protein [Ostreococcus tauri]